MRRLFPALTPPRVRPAMALGALLAVFLLAACGGAGDSAAGPAGGQGASGDDPAAADAEAELRPVTVGLGSVTFGPDFAYHSSVPLALGYWEEEGLDVELLGFAGSGAVVQAVDADQVDYGVASTPPQFAAASRGADLIAFYTHITSNFFIPTVPEDSDIQTIADLEGATIGVQSLESSAVPLIEAMLEAEGVPLESVTFVAVGQGAEALSILQSGRIDALGLWDGPHAQIENLGQPLREVSNDFFDQLGFQSVVMTREAEFQERPEDAIGLARGIAKAMVFTSENPQAALRLHWEVFPESKPVGVSDEEALAQGLRILEARLENTQPVNGQLGLATEQQITDYMQVLIDSGQIDSPVPVDEVWTDEFLDEINDFDQEAIREEARSYE